VCSNSRRFIFEIAHVDTRRSIEAGARAGMVAPDEITFSYLKGRPLAPQGALWDPALQNWSQLHSDANAKWDAIIHIRAEDIAPTITWGTSPQEVVPITGRIPYAENASTEERKRAMERMLEYMGLVAGTPVEDIKIDRVSLP
jgi:3-isopropylmalate dehydratase